MHYFQFNIGDYVSSTQHLDENEDLAYRRMLDIYYSKELPLPIEQKDIGRLIRMRTHSESIATVLEEFFTLKKDGYHCERADKEILAFQSKSDKARKSAEARWNKNKDLPLKEVDANALRTECEGNAKHKTLNTKHKTITKEILSLINDVFAHWWNLYPSSRRKNKGGCLTKFKAKCKGMTEDQIIELVDKMSADVAKRVKEIDDIKFLPSTEPYLTQERWKDEE